MTKNLLIAALLSTAGAVAFAQTPATPVAKDTTAAPAVATKATKAGKKHAKKHSAKKAAKPAAAAASK